MNCDQMHSNAAHPMDLGKQKRIAIKFFEVD